MPEPEQSNGQVRALVCDLDGVLRHLDAEQQARIETEHGLRAGAVLEVAFEPHRLTPAVTGAVTDAMWRAGVARSLADLIGADQANRVVQLWSDSPGTVDADMLAIIRQLRAQLPVVLLSNATSRLDDDLARLDLPACFDAIVNSARTGHPKPEPEAFEATQLIVDDLCGSPIARNEVLFVDDSARHVLAAGEFGWTAVRFVDVADLLPILAEHGLVQVGQL